MQTAHLDTAHLHAWAPAKHEIDADSLPFVLQLIPVGQVDSGFNFQPNVHKRVLNAVSLVSDSDNVKQDLSIDVYNRNKGAGAMGEIV
jgi:hypothetical protein